MTIYVDLNMTSCLPVFLSSFSCVVRALWISYFHIAELQSLLFFQFLDPYVRGNQEIMAEAGAGGSSCQMGKDRVWLLDQKIKPTLYYHSTHKRFSPDRGQSKIANLCSFWECSLLFHVEKWEIVPLTEGSPKNKLSSSMFLSAEKSLTWSFK